MHHASLRAASNAEPDCRRALAFPEPGNHRDSATAPRRIGTLRRSLLSGGRWIAVSCIAVSATVVSVVSGSPRAAAATDCAPQQISVAPDTGLDNLFQSYGNSGTGKTWTGGDGTESVALPDGRDLWLFDDSFLGTVIDGLRNRAKTPYIHNAFVIESHGALTTTLYTHGDPRAKEKQLRTPSAYVNPVPSDPFNFGFFPGPAVVNGNSVQVLMELVTFKKIKHQIGNITFFGDYLGVFSLPSLALVHLAPLPSSSVEWTDGTLSDGGFTYIYGTNAGNVYAARVSGTNLTTPWTYYNGHTWTTDASGAASIEHAGRRSHLSVSKVSGSFGSGYAFITEFTNVVAAFGCSPVGPFGTTHVIYTPPEPSTYPHSYGVITYNAHAHPELSPASNVLVVSYDVNPAVPGGLGLPDASIYRPRFIEVTLQ